MTNFGSYCIFIRVVLKQLFFPCVTYFFEHFRKNMLYLNEGGKGKFPLTVGNKRIRKNPLTTQSSIDYFGQRTHRSHFKKKGLCQIE